MRVWSRLNAGSIRAYVRFGYKYQPKSHHNRMHILSDHFHPETFRQELGNSAHRVLMLDYDGTLAPFVEDRDKAFPYPGVRELLEKIHADSRNRLVIISGRAVDDVLKLLGIKPAPEIWGSHGYEHRLENGTYVQHDAPEEVVQALADSTTLILDAGLGDRLETKPLSIAVHWRGQDTATADQINQNVRRLWDDPVKDGKLQMHEFDGGLELRIPGRTKGNAVAETIREQSTDALYAYFGDDYTDEDAFAELKGKGLSVLVRSEPRDTIADIKISPPGELLEWLSLWIL